MKQCESGHLYDELKYSSCPYCNRSRGIGMIRSLAESSNSNPAFPKTMPLHIAPSHEVAPSHPNVTMPLASQPSSLQPVYGWLVIIEGKQTGHCYQLYGGKNYAGRGKDLAIDLSFDATLSQDARMIILYDEKENRCYLTMGEGKSNVYYNGQVLLMPVELKDYDKIEFGASKLVFRSFCNETFQYPS